MKTKLPALPLVGSVTTADLIYLVQSGVSYRATIAQVGTAIGGGGGGGSGTVTSVALALPSGIFSVSGSPVTASGTLTGVLATQAANEVLAGPTTGSAAQPTFRALVAGDIPSLSYDASGAAATAQSAAESFATSAIAAYAGSTNVVTVGTIATGTWAGTPIAVAHGGTGSTSAGAALTALGAQAGPLTSDVTTSGAAATVVALQGHGIATTAPSDTYVLTWVASTSKWTPVAAGGGGGSPGGSSGDVQFNDGSGGFAGDPNLTWDAADVLLKIANSATPVYIGSLQGFAAYAAIYLGSASPSTSNYAFGGDGNNNLFNAVTSLAFRISNNGFLGITDSHVFLGSASGSSTATVSITNNSPTWNALSIKGYPSQTAPLIDLQQISSTSTPRDVAYVDGQFNSAVDASFTGAAVLDAVSYTGTEHGLRIDATGSGANAAWFDSAAPNYQAMVGGHFLPNCTTAPTGNPSGGGFFYVTAGALWYLGSSGTSTKIANA